MSQIAEPVIAGLEVIEHFGEVCEVLARLMAPVRSSARPAARPAARSRGAAASVGFLYAEHARCLRLSHLFSQVAPRTSRAYSRVLPVIEAAISGAGGRSASALRAEALRVIAAADAL